MAPDNKSARNLLRGGKANQSATMPAKKKYITL